MKFKNILLAAVACCASILPAQARIEESTGRLLRVISSNGIAVTFNTTDCATHNIHGAYITVGSGVGVSREMVLCPGEWMDAIDHSTVRHEMAHVLQHCVNVQRGTHRNTPIIQDIQQLASLVNQYVSEDDVTFIKSSYPREKWLLEFEANYVQNAMTSTQLIELWDEFNCARVFR